MIRLTLWGVVLLVVIIGYLDSNPIQLDSEDKIESGTPLTAAAEGDVLIVVDYHAFPTDPESFDDVDFSLAWYNTFQQEVGPVSVVDSDTFSGLDLAPFHIIIITRSASHHTEWLPMLSSFTTEGNTLVLEMPKGDLRQRFSADGLSGERDPLQQMLTFNGLPPELLQDLQRTPLHTKLIGSTNFSLLQDAGDTERMMAIDGAPVLYRRKFGQGWAVTFDFDYGRMLTSIQQGRPTKAFRIRDQRGSGEIEAADLALSDDMMGFETPVADALERFVVYSVIGRCYPIVAFWPFWKGLDGALIVTHDENGQGDSSVWMAKYEDEGPGEKPNNYRSTYFLESEGDITEIGLQKLTEYGMDIALSWDRAGDDQPGASQRLGVGIIEPIAKALTLDEQSKRLIKKQEEARPLINARIKNHLWDRDWSTPFRIMAAADFRADSTYAPLPGKVGYPFGTGLPFMPLDRTGLAFTNFFEFPMVLIAAGEPEEQQQLSVLLKQSQKRDHQAIGVSFSPSAFLETPSAKLFLTWRGTYDIAKQYRHWITSIEKMLRFNLARQNGKLTTKIFETTFEDERMTRIDVEALAREGEMYISVPDLIGDRRFHRAFGGIVRIEGGSNPRSTGTSNSEGAARPLEAREVDLMGNSRQLLRLEKGFNFVTVYYKPKPKLQED